MSANDAGTSGAHVDDGGDKSDNANFRSVTQRATFGSLFSTRKGELNRRKRQVH